MKPSQLIAEVHERLDALYTDFRARYNFNVPTHLMLTPRDSRRWQLIMQQAIVESGFNPALRVPKEDVEAISAAMLPPNVKILADAPVSGLLLLDEKEEDVLMGLGYRNEAVFLKEITIEDPDTKLPIEIAIYKAKNSGAIFGVDSSFVEQLDEPAVVQDVFQPVGFPPLELIEEPSFLEPATQPPVTPPAAPAHE